MHRAGPLPSGTRASEPVEIPMGPVWAVARKMPQQAAWALSPGFARLPPGFARCNSWESVRCDSNLWRKCQEKSFVTLLWSRQELGIVGSVSGEIALGQMLMMI